MKNSLGVFGNNSGHRHHRKGLYNEVYSFNLEDSNAKIQIRVEILELVFKRKNGPNTTSTSRLNQGKILKYS